MKRYKGILTISFDFELYWGVRDKHTIQQYRNNLYGTGNAIKGILALFTEYNIHATWATVGFLFFNSLNELKQNLPSKQPDYTSRSLSPYNYIDEHEQLDKTCHFASELIERIKNCDGQEIGAHTFSHYYCLENGQNVDTFKEDITFAINIAKSKGITTSSLALPRNQCNLFYHSVLKELGIKCYRENEKNWAYKATNEKQQDILKRAIRLLDAYFNLTGYHTYSLQECGNEKPFMIPSSRFLRPWSKKLAYFDNLRLNRIKSAMKDAALNHNVFHIWWHPHNF